MKSAFIGALISLAITVGYLTLGPTSFGIPTGAGAEIVLAPGIAAGLLASRFGFPWDTCIAVGVIAMVIFGAVLGFVVDWFFGDSKGVSPH